MNLAAAILGQTAVAKLQESARSAVLEIGSDKISRRDLAKVDCYNFHAARLLSGVLHTLGVKSLRQVYDEYPPAALAVPGMGVISLAVLGAAFEAKGIGGETPLENYVRKHAKTNGAGKIVTFDTLKDREQKERRQEARERKRRTRQRRDQAHAQRVERFLDQKEG